MSKPLREALPHEFFQEFMDTPAAKLLDVPITSTHEGHLLRWPGPHKNVHLWWKLQNGKAVGWNENPARGWSFPVFKLPTAG